MATKDEKLYTLQTEQQPTQTAAQPAMTTQTTTMQPVSYIDNSGQKQQGVAEVPTAAGTAETGTSGTGSYYDEMRSYYQNMYDEAMRHNNEAAATAAERAREAAEAQRQALATGYQGTNRQLYRDYMNNQRTLPQQMAAAGYSGGLSESARLRLRNSYEEALAENERARLGQQAAADMDLSQRLYEIQAQADAGNQQARQQQLAYETALREQMRQDQMARADTLAAAGDFSGYAGLGYSQNEIDALTRAWLASNPGMTSAWISAHPEDAKRLGINNPSTESYGGGYYTQAAETAETGKASTDLNRMVQQAVYDGTPWKAIRETLDDMVNAGEITPAERTGAMTYVYTNSNNGEDIPAQSTQPSKNRFGSIWQIHSFGD